MEDNVIEIKIPKKAIRFDLSGQKVLVDLPTVAQTKDFREKLSKKEESGKSFEKILEDYLISLGLDIEILKGLQDEQIVEISKILTGQKKI
tara:strand:+ start:1560 stop:1832 length:273 start_codon:yes stop_codon:yes gene_type:complete